MLYVLYMRGRDILLLVNLFQRDSGDVDIRRNVKTYVKELYIGKIVLPV